MDKKMTEAELTNKISAKLLVQQEEYDTRIKNLIDLLDTVLNQQLKQELSNVKQR